MADRMLYASDVRRSLGEWLDEHRHRDALAREMCVWGNPGGILAARGDDT